MGSGGAQDPHKFARAQELLRMNEEIKEARKVSKWRACCSPGLKALCSAGVLGLPQQCLLRATCG